MQDVKISYTFLRGTIMPRSQQRTIEVFYNLCPICEENIITRTGRGKYITKKHTR